MSRSLTAAIVAALAAENLTACMFCRLDFDSGTVFTTSLAHSKDWDGQTWLGLGNLGNVEAITEGENIEAYGIRLTLSGIPVYPAADSALMSVMLSEAYQGRRVRIWFAPLDASHAVIADPVLVFRGRMDTPEIEVGSTASIKLPCEGRLADLNRQRVGRYTHEDQIARFPNDRAFEFVPQMQQKELYWGQKTPAGATQ